VKSTAAIVVGLVVCVSVVMFLFWGRRREIYRDNLVVVEEISRPIDLLRIHASPVKYLTTYGCTYVGVRGTAPFYLKVPGVNAILFVTEEDRYRIHFNIVNIETGAATRIDGRTEGFGWDIGAPRSGGEPYTDVVDEVRTNEVIAATYLERSRIRYFLNMSSQKLDRVEMDYYDDKHQITNHVVYVDGKRAK